MTFVSDLEPTELWRHFDKILTIPRGSQNEDAIGKYIIDIAKKHDLSYKQDQTGNIVVTKPATPGHEQAAITILQAHLDMVNEKNADVKHDFTKDSIKPRKVDHYLYATGTTLGSDNGIGVAASLAVIENKSSVHGPLEFLFTVDEETGLTGAASLSSDLLKGRRLINMDTEEEGALYVGCAGGAGVNLSLPLEFTQAPKDSVALEIKLYGLLGGHSGVDIHLQKGNAVKLLVRALNSVMQEKDFLLVSISGGNMHNAIPREAFATVILKSNDEKRFIDKFEKVISEIQTEFNSVEPGMKMSVEKTDSQPRVMNQMTTQKVLNLIHALPHGVISMSYDIPDLVETSSNLASAKIEDSKMRIHVSNRSSVESAIRGIQERVASIGELAGTETEELEGYPGWKPDLDSKLLKIAQELHPKVLGTEPVVKAVHAGLECGIIGEKYPGMDMISFGPQIEFPHSPDERVEINSVANFYKLLLAMLERLANENQPG